ncbi:hypothetical protein LTR53_007516 [Teratosphaeriaceae sp. CCFEE 6253]|nr:hypothetical protein LTR53_007516 [Teratosphaeriaceae sp. CCFEE 6253]
MTSFSTHTAPPQPGSSTASDTEGFTPEHTPCASDDGMAETPHLQMPVKRVLTVPEILAESNRVFLDEGLKQRHSTFRAHETCAGLDGRLTGLTDLDFLHRYISTVDISPSASNGMRAHNIVKMLETQAKGEVDDTANAGGVSASHKLDVTAKLHTLEQRLDSMNSCIQTEAMCRASMSALGRESKRQRDARASQDYKACAARRASTARDHGRAAQQHLSDLLLARDEREGSDGDSEEEEDDEEEYRKATDARLAALENAPPGLVDLRDQVANLNVSLVGGFENTRRRLCTSEEAHGAFRGQLEEVRVTITSYDTEIESANCRIAKLERDLGDGLNDSRLTASESQLVDLENKHEHLAQQVLHGCIQQQFKKCAQQKAVTRALGIADKRLAGLELYCDGASGHSRLDGVEEQLEEVALEASPAHRADQGYADYVYQIRCRWTRRRRRRGLSASVHQAGRSRSL